MDICGGGCGLCLHHHIPILLLRLTFFQWIQTSFGNGSQTINREPWPGTPLLSTVIRPL